MSGPLMSVEAIKAEDAALRIQFDTLVEIRNLAQDGLDSIHARRTELLKLEGIALAHKLAEASK